MLEPKLLLMETLKAIQFPLNGYRYIRFDFLNSVLSIFSLISWERGSYAERLVKHLAKSASTKVDNEEKNRL